MQRTIRAGRAEVVETALDVIVEEESRLSGARMPAAAAPDTMNSQLADKLLVGWRKG